MAKTSETTEETEGRLCQCFSHVAYYIDPNDPNRDVEAGDTGAIPVHESCGQTVASKKATFRPGHDAKLKGALQRAYRGGYEFYYLDGGMLVSVGADTFAASVAPGLLEQVTAPVKPKAKRVRKPKPLEVGDTVKFKSGRGESSGVITSTNGTKAEVVYTNAKGEEKTVIKAVELLSR